RTARRAGREHRTELALGAEFAEGSRPHERWTGASEDRGPRPSEPAGETRHLRRVNVEQRLPHIQAILPGPEAQKVLALDRQFVSPSYTRDYPLVARRGEGMFIEDVDGNTFLDFTAGIAVASTGHCHPDVARAIARQAETLIHMSGTDFYYPLMARLAEKLAAIAPGDFPKRGNFGHSCMVAMQAVRRRARD